MRSELEWIRASRFVYKRMIYEGRVMSSRQVRETTGKLVPMSYEEWMDHPITVAHYKEWESER